MKQYEVRIIYRRGREVANAALIEARRRDQEATLTGHHLYVGVMALLADPMLSASAAVANREYSYSHDEDAVAPDVVRVAQALATETAELDALMFGTPAGAAPAIETLGPPIPPPGAGWAVRDELKKKLVRIGLHIAVAFAAYMLYAECLPKKELKL